MSDKPLILVGLVILLGLVTFPAWYSFGAGALYSTEAAPPDLGPPAGALKLSTASSLDAPDLTTLSNEFEQSGMEPLSSEATLTSDTGGDRWRISDQERRYLVLKDESQGNLEVYDGCVEDVEYMRANHMALLIEWREGVIRHGDTGTVEINGQEFPKSLVKTCLGCHTDREAFCFRCHEYANTLPAWPARNTSGKQEGIRCWNCHLQPEEE